MKTVILDTETTDLIKNHAVKLSLQPHMIEFFGVLCDENGKSLEECHHLIRPPIKITPEITKITNITNDMVKDCPLFSGVADDIAAFLAKADEMVAHNLAYDKAIIQFEFDRLNLPIKFPDILTCTVEQTEYIKGYRLKLSELHQMLFNKGFDGAHRANNDTYALKNCYFELMKRGMI